MSIFQLHCVRRGSHGYTHDTAIGLGVDLNGNANLPLRAGATQFFVANGGADGNAGTSPSAPLATIAAGVAKLRQGMGDQLLLAQGSSWPERFADGAFNSKDGFNPAYPTVVQSYNPTDPLNTSLYGRATGNRPMMNTSSVNMLIALSDPAPNYLAFRGLDVAPSNVAALGLGMVPGAAAHVNYVLWENCIFRYTGLAYDGSSLTTSNALKFIIRNCSFFGSWDTTGFGQSIYTDYMDGLTVEDNHFFHSGWRLGATRGEGLSTGGGSWFGHTMYLQKHNFNSIIRRNVMLDSISESASCRGDTVFEQNVGIRNAVSVGLGSGNNYDTSRPGGVMLTARYNAFIESSITPGGDGTPGLGANSVGMWSVNGKLGSAGHHNLMARSTNLNGGYALVTGADFNVPSYMDWYDNVIDSWDNPGHNVEPAADSAFPAQVFMTFNRNYWDDAASGTNLNISSLTRPNRHTFATLWAALGYASEAAFISDLQFKPELRLGRRLLPILQAGYGVDTSGMVL